MPTANEDLLDTSIRHQVGLLRLSTATARKVVALLNRVDDDLVAQILKYDPTEVRGEWSRKRLEKLLEAVRTTNKDVYNRLTKLLDGELRGLASYEAEFQNRAIRGALPVQFDIVTPAPEQLYAAVHARPFQGRLLKEYYSGLEQQAQRRLREAIRMGFVEGETIDQIVRRVRGTAKLQYKDGILETNRRAAEAVVRTAVNHTASVARSETYRANAKLIKGIRWVSTLDGRTSAICRSRDGEVYPVDSGPRPPAHWNCRSTTTPVLRSWKELGLDLKEAPEGTRSSMNGQVPAAETYQTWLRKQPRAFVEDVLGKTKAKLYLDGKLDLDRFVDRKGAEYTLDELQRREASAFAKAGL